MINWINSWQEGNKKEKYNIEIRLGKFGRCLGELHIDMVDGQEKLTLVSLNELLIKEGHAVEYHGGKR